MPRNRDRRGRFDFKHNWSVRQVKKHPKATLSVLGILVALVGILFFTGSTPGSTPDFDLDFEEVVNPTRQMEPWRREACRLHDRIHAYNPSLSPQPLHSILGINPKSSPFHPASLSSKPGQRNHKALQNLLTQRLAERQREPARDLHNENDVQAHYIGDGKWTYQRRGNSEWLYILAEVARFLADDEYRAGYAEFVDALTGTGVLEMIGAKGKEGVLAGLCWR